MARMGIGGDAGGKNGAGQFFLATLLLWMVSLVFEMVFNRRTELVCVICGGFFFQSADWIVRSWLSRDPLFVNTSISLFHSIITSASVVFILVNQCLAKGLDEMFDHSELFGGTWQWAYPALCFSCGYFAYDQWDMLQFRLYSGIVPSILVHHVALVCFILALYRNVTINYLILTLILRKLRRLAGIRDASTALVKLEWTVNWAYFVFVRCIPHVLITIKLIKDAHKFGKGMELPLALFGMAGMNLLNAGLGLDLFHAFKRERTLRRNQQSNNHSHGE